MEKLTPKLWNWASLVEGNTLEQAKRTSEMPFVQPYLALMPDAHLGKGSTVGSVIPTIGAIMPAAVGVDIGCGMIAVRTQFDRHYHGVPMEITDLSVLRKNIERSIPLSAGNRNHKIHAEYTFNRLIELENLAPGADFYDEFGDWRMQLGSLGSGNHFIEISYDEEDRIWLFLHSGSRGVGNKIATTHIRLAKKECAEENLPDADLAYFLEGTYPFRDYMRDLKWAQRFALLNREEMMDRVIDQVSRYFGEPVVEQERVNCHHNYTEIIGENNDLDYHSNVYLTRKGAIDASLGKPGLIPGSMATASYVVEGLGNLDSFNSAPHGAGRPFSRTEAKKRFTYEQLETAMQGIEWSHSAAFLDEIPMAYKGIDIVMADAVDLVSIKHELHQLVNIKGN